MEITARRYLFLARGVPLAPQFTTLTLKAKGSLAVSGEWRLERCEIGNFVFSYIRKGGGGVWIHIHTNYNDGGENRDNFSKIATFWRT